MSGIKSLKGLILGSSLYSIVLRLCGISSVWYFKRQNTVESSTFGSEFVALRTATELDGFNFVEET